jgi:hypothetical protein
MATADLGQRILAPDENDNRYYFQCIKDGDVDPVAAPDFTDAYVVDDTVERANSTHYRKGATIRVFSASTDVYFECTDDGGAMGMTGAAPPMMWNTGDTDTTVDGDVTWTARTASLQWVADNDVIWACRVAAGIRLNATATIEQCRIYGFTNAGVHVHAGGEHYPKTAANAFVLDNLRIVACGVGVATRGKDSNAGTVMRVRMSGIGTGDYVAMGIYAPSPFDDTVGGVGLWDGSELGDYHFGNFVESQTGPSYIVGRDKVATSTLPDGTTRRWSLATRRGRTMLASVPLETTASSSAATSSEPSPSTTTAAR